MHRNVTAVIEAGRRIGLEVRPKEFPQSTRTAAEAAAAIGVELGQIVKSLIFTVDDRPVLALVGGDRQLDEAKLAAAAGGAVSRRPDADTVRAVTGFPVGGVPPFGFPTALPVFVDPGLLDYDEVWAAAGTPHVNFPIDPHQLVAATAGTVTDVARLP
ncbi:MAG TPA: YbaK/EbsC family protein [Acidimicrobiales bacterium]|jgi:prolyl-tRNA editing enzyme YbaK/EbsC (Cys-tRNA(Pro) deacylase)|nr:YbaK/EbsC family protein [Acidimicrobiales bacterium]